jgi:sec-independent protein translocase protein TatA
MWEWFLLLLTIAALFFLAPSKLPAFARSIGRAWGELRKARLEVEREVREMEKGP